MKQANVTSVNPGAMWALGLDLGSVLAGQVDGTIDPEDMEALWREACVISDLALGEALPPPPTITGDPAIDHEAAIVYADESAEILGLRIATLRGPVDEALFLLALRATLAALLYQPANNPIANANLIAHLEKLAADARVTKPAATLFAAMRANVAHDVVCKRLKDMFEVVTKQLAWPPVPAVSEQLKVGTGS